MTSGNTDFTPRAAEVSRFQVRYLPAGHQFEGAGWVDVGPEIVSFVMAPNGVITKTVEFRRADLVEIEWHADDHRLRVSDRDGNSMTAWASPSDAAEFQRALPARYSSAKADLEREHRAFQARLAAIGPMPRATPILIALNVLVFFVMAYAGAGILAPDGEVHVGFGSNYGPRTWTGEPWRLISSAFLHFGIVHLAFNMYALYQGGMLTERLFGTARFVTIYLLAAVAGSVVSGWWEPVRNSAGASGAVFGVYGALLVFFAVRRKDLPASILKAASRGALTLVIYSLAMGSVAAGVDNACHVGGLLAGTIAGWMLIRPLDVESRRKSQPARVAATVALIGVAVTLLSAPNWRVDTARHADLVFRRTLYDFSATERRLIDVTQEILRRHEAGELGGAHAAERLTDEVIEPWHDAAEPFLALPVPRARESAGARRFLAFQDYLTAREHALRLTAQVFERREPVPQAALDGAWRRVTQLIDALQEGETSPGPEGRTD